jgi:hypothetical protein
MSGETGADRLSPLDRPDRPFVAAAAFAPSGGERDLTREPGAR